jgi:hypothetical protein
MILKDWQGSDEARKRFQNRIDQYKKDKIKLDNSTINKNKIKKNKSTLLVISAIFFNQHQPTVIQINLNHSDTSNENSVKAIELPIKSSDKYHEWYLDSYASAHFTNNKRYFKNYR